MQVKYPANSPGPAIEWLVYIERRQIMILGIAWVVLQIYDGEYNDCSFKVAVRLFSLNFGRPTGKT